MVGDGGLHGERGPHRVGGIAERGHHRIADGLHHRAVMVAHDGGQQGEMVAHHVVGLRHRPPARRARSSRCRSEKSSATWLTPASSPGRKVAAAKRSRKACSEITSGAVSASRVQVRSSISAASSKPASFTNSMVPPASARRQQPRRPTPSRAGRGTAPPSCSTSTNAPGWSVRSAIAARRQIDRHAAAAPPAPAAAGPPHAASPSGRRGRTRRSISGRTAGAGAKDSSTFFSKSRS